jgi:hypothetical protein
MILFTSLPKVGGHSTLTLGLCRMLKPYFSTIEVWCKIMPEHGHSTALSDKLEALGCRVHLLSDQSGRLLLPALGHLLWSFLSTPPDVFFKLAMRHLSPLLAFFSRARVRVYYQITHDMKPATIRTIRTYARVFSKIVFIFSMAALESLQHGVPAVICRTGGLRSFAHPDLGPAPENVIRLVEPKELPAVLADLSRQPSPSWNPTGSACLAHYDRYFSNAAILKRWTDLLIHES